MTSAIERAKNFTSKYVKIELGIDF